MSKVAWYISMRHVRDYYSGQQCGSAGLFCCLGVRPDYGGRQIRWPMPMRGLIVGFVGEDC